MTTMEPDVTDDAIRQLDEWEALVEWEGRLLAQAETLGKGAIHEADAVVLENRRFALARRCIELGAADEHLRRCGHCRGGRHSDHPTVSVVYCQRGQDLGLAALAAHEEER